MGNLPFWETTVGLPLSAINSKCFWTKKIFEPCQELNVASYCCEREHLGGLYTVLCAVSSDVVLVRKEAWFSIHMPLTCVHNEAVLLECLDLSTSCARNFKMKPPKRTKSDYCSRLKWLGLKYRSLKYLRPVQSLRLWAKQAWISTSDWAQLSSLVFFKVWSGAGVTNVVTFLTTLGWPNRVDVRMLFCNSGSPKAARVKFLIEIVELMTPVICVLFLWDFVHWEITLPACASVSSVNGNNNNNKVYFIG